MLSAFDFKHIRKLDWILHEPSRLSIVFALRSGEALSFVELKTLLGMTDGNLSIHLRTLEEKGYLSTSRTKDSGKPRKLCRLTADGRQAFDRYLGVLEQIVQASRSETVEPR